MFDSIEDTIVAISSAAGMGVRGIIRLSGPRAFELADHVFTSASPSTLARAGGHQRRFGLLRLGEHACIPAEAYLFRAPASYTRQDLVELHTLGSPPLLAVALESFAAAGARHAQPGEFTGRAYLAGALDLTEVEGVAAMIHAQTDAQLRASEALLHGELGRRTRRMRDELADLTALVEAEIDFAEEPIEFITPQHVFETVHQMAGQLEDLISHSSSVERLEVLPRVVLVGLPNAGKSTLFNRLTGIDRAIQSSVAGTTRDIITAPLHLTGGEVIICDTAGIGDDARPATGGSDVLLAQAMGGATSSAIATADLVLVVIDACDNPAGALSWMIQRLGGRRFAVVLNKMDILGTQAQVNLPGVVSKVSARCGQGMEQLRLQIGEILFADAEKHGQELISLTERQRGALQDAREALARAEHLSSNLEDADHVPFELLAVEIRHAMHALSLLIGEVTTEDLLGRIFSRFCIGK